MLETLFQSLVVALSAVGLTVVLRNAPIIRTWVFQMKKPWACNVCLPLYLCALGVGSLYALSRDLKTLLAYLPAYAIAYLVLEKMSRPPTKDPFVPEEFSVPLEPKMFPDEEVTPSQRGRT